MRWKNVEPVGEKQCQECGSQRELLAEQDDLDNAVCPKCMYEEYGDEFLEEWVIGAGIVVDPDDHDDFVVFDFGFGIEAQFELTREEMPASNRPSETDTVYYRETDSNKASIYYNGDKLSEVPAEDWASYADEQLKEKDVY